MPPPAKSVAVPRASTAESEGIFGPGADAGPLALPADGGAPRIVRLARGEAHRFGAACDSRLRRIGRTRPTAAGLRLWARCDRSACYPSTPASSRHTSLHSFPVSSPDSGLHPLSGRSPSHLRTMPLLLAEYTSRPPR